MSHTSNVPDDAGSRVRLYDSGAHPADQRTALRQGEVPVAVHGLGKLGLPVAAVFAEMTGAVTGVDVDESVVEPIRSGNCPIPEEPGLSPLVEELVEDGSLDATVDPSAVEASIHVVVVPTLLTGENPDLSALRSALRGVASTLEPGDVVFVESTVPPGTTDSLAVELLATQSGLDPSEFGVAFCPERTQTGRALRDVRGAHPKVVGGVDDESERVAALVYGELTGGQIIRTTDATTAECVKLFEGVYRDVNIALANELARLSEDVGIDGREAIEAANTQPFCEIHDPGPGVGGHCIPYYPYFLVSSADEPAPLIERSRAVNDSMPAYVADEIVTLLSREGIDVEDATVGILGVTYRPGVPETRESPALDLCRILSTLGADVLGVDPMLDIVDTRDVDLPLVHPDRMQELSGCLDAGVLVTPHEAFEGLDWSEMERMVLVDGRDEFDLGDTHHRTHTIGDGCD